MTKFVFNFDRKLNNNCVVVRFPEIIAELTKKPKDDNYYERFIWPDKKA